MKKLFINLKIFQVYYTMLVQRSNKSIFPNLR